MIKSLSFSEQDICKNENKYKKNFKRNNQNL